MPSFLPLPLGQRIPDCTHAVSVSLPTMGDVKGYEEKKPEVVSRMPSGYPRFVVHPLARQLGERLSAKAGLKGRRLWLTTSRHMAESLVRYLNDASASLFLQDGVNGVAHADEPGLSSRAKSFLQHTGGFLSSREAEDKLVALGAISAAGRERLGEGDPQVEAWRLLSPFLSGAAREDAFFASSGTNAVYAAFRAIDGLQRSRGRSVWIQLGWLYLDTIAILQKFSAAPEDYRHVRKIDDRESLERLFAEEGTRIAGIVAEAPTNPLIQTPDVAWLSELAHRHGARLVLDPSVASIYSVDLLPYADILVTSLTKYAAFEGDVIAGLAVVNPAGADAEELRRRLPAEVEPLYGRDQARLAYELRDAVWVTERIEDNLRKVVAFLETRPEVTAVHWSRGKAGGGSFSALARTPRSVGGMLSFETRLPLAAFYDALALPKGPSFGMSTTLVCPFIWLGHYDLVTSAEGRVRLAESGINPDLVRLSLGTEPAEEILRALEAAFAEASSAAAR